MCVLLEPHTRNKSRRQHEYYDLSKRFFSSFFFQRVLFDALATTDRAAAILAARNIIDQYGWLLDARTFSGMAMSFRFELVARSASDYISAMRMAGMQLNAEGEARLLAAGARIVEGGDPNAIFEAVLSLTFRHVEGQRDLRHTIASVPG